jgi:catechol 2,3-dioxygenase-like lactoylglutathione lyase family enzyme
LDCGRLARRAAHPPDDSDGLCRVLGRFHEFSIATADIRAAVEFYEALGFSHASTTDTWTHPYGVLTDGRLCIGLHQRRTPSPALTFVAPGIAARLGEFASHGVDLTLCRTGDEVFNEIGFTDPSGQAVTVLEARTYSPVDRDPALTSLCGYFDAISLPEHDFAIAQSFWEKLGFVATAELDSPYVHLSLTSDTIDLEFHRPRTLEAPLLVFRDAGMRERIAKLRAQHIQLSRDLPRGLDPTANAMLESPDGTCLLLLEDTD